jgi:arylsulfatase A-like enzyme
MDFVPTILELAGLQHPVDLTYRGRPIAPLLGCSWVPFLSALKSSASETSGHTNSSIHNTEYAVGARNLRFCLSTTW